MSISIGPALGVLLGTASACYLCGVYFQQADAEQNIEELVQTDPYAYHIREKIYRVLRFFKSRMTTAVEAPDHSNIPTSTNNTNPEQTNRIQQIMKYGFPGLDDIKIYKDFVLSYDRRNRVAHWVCEHLHPENVRPQGNVSGRNAVFQPDMNVPSNFRSDLNDYLRSGFTRGHLAAAGNHRARQSHCSETFFLTNIAPQVGKGFNNDAWNNLEIYVRELAERYKSVYVCTGPLYKPTRHTDGKWIVQYELIGSNMVAVPTHFFKVVIIESKLAHGKPYMEAYVMPNAPISNDTNLRSFLCSIREIEHWAGLQFFNGIRRDEFFGSNYARTSQIFRQFN